MDRRNRVVRAVERPIQQAPAAPHSVRVDVTLDVFDGVIHELMKVLDFQVLIRLHGVREHFGSGFNMFFDDGLKDFLLSAPDNLSANGPTTRHKACHRRLILATRPGYLPFSNAPVHVPDLATDEGLINLNLSFRLLYPFRW